MKIKAKIREMRASLDGAKVEFEITMIGTCSPEDQRELISKFHSCNKWSIDITEETLDIEIEHDGRKT